MAASTYALHHGLPQDSFRACGGRCWALQIDLIVLKVAQFSLPRRLATEPGGLHPPVPNPNTYANTRHVQQACLANSTAAGHMSTSRYILARVAVRLLGQHTAAAAHGTWDAVACANMQAFAFFYCSRQALCAFAAAGREGRRV